MTLQIFFKIWSLPLPGCHLSHHHLGLLDTERVSWCYHSTPETSNDSQQFLWHISLVLSVFLIGRLRNCNYSCSSWRNSFFILCLKLPQLEVQVTSMWVFWFQPWVPCWNSAKLGGASPLFGIATPTVPKAKHLLEDLCHRDVGQHDQAPWVIYLVADPFISSKRFNLLGFFEACEGLPYSDGCKDLSNCLRVWYADCLDVCRCQGYFKLWKSIFFIDFSNPHHVLLVKPLCKSLLFQTKDTKTPRHQHFWWNIWASGMMICWVHPGLNGGWWIHATTEDFYCTLCGESIRKQQHKNKYQMPKEVFFFQHSHIWFDF